ncbi:hypothetical protein [Sphingopyxis sp. Root1497]|uniref:hypothetical protein n=1 Tax=Sphingopyxis sp. Root1497 TaxID=1736474 RepID=UPI0012E35D21|nr:hypothetical protein [Sphingopyxis sp. Root1497]
MGHQPAAQHIGYPHFFIVARTFAMGKQLKRPVERRRARELQVLLENAVGPGSIFAMIGSERDGGLEDRDRKRLVDDRRAVDRLDMATEKKAPLHFAQVGEFNFMDAGVARSAIALRNQGKGMLPDFAPAFHLTDLRVDDFALKPVELLGHPVRRIPIFDIESVLDPLAGRFLIAFSGGRTRPARCRLRPVVFGISPCHTRAPFFA